MTGRVRATLAAAALLLGACGAAPGASSPASSTTPATATAATTPSTSSAPTAAPTASAAAAATAGAYTADDEQIAAIIRESETAAVPDLMTVASLTLKQQAALFLPVRAWIKAQTGKVDDLAATACTSAAVKLFKDGMERYRNIAQDFLDWREWGAAGLPYARSAPLQAAKLLTGAVSALAATCAVPS
jgi:hypothetical protein